MKRFILALFFTLIIVSPVNAQSTLALQEKCAEGAKKIFREEYGDGISKSELMYGGFTTHYNKKFDKCFILLKLFYLSKDKDHTGFYTISLIDVFEGKDYGSFSSGLGSGLPGGKVGDKFCRSEAEFEALIKPYMEE